MALDGRSYLQMCNLQIIRGQLHALLPSAAGSPGVVVTVHGA